MSISGRSWTFCERRVVELWQSGRVNATLRVAPCCMFFIWSVGCLYATYALEGARRKPFALGRQLQVEHIQFSICFIVNMHRITLTAFI